MQSAVYEKKKTGERWIFFKYVGEQHAWNTWMGDLALNAVRL